MFANAIAIAVALYNNDNDDDNYDDGVMVGGWWASETINNNNNNQILINYSGMQHSDCYKMFSCLKNIASISIFPSNVSV